MNLFETAAQIRNLVADCDDEIPADLEQQIDALNLAFETKIAALCGYIRELKAHQAAVEGEIKRLQALGATSANREKWAKDYLLRCLDLAGTRRVDTDFFKVWAQASPPSAEVVVTADALPERFRSVKTTVSVNKAALLQAWRDGEALPEGVTVSRGTTLQIR